MRSPRAIKREETRINQWFLRMKGKYGRETHGDRLYMAGALQALGWVLGTSEVSPTQVDTLIHRP